MMAYDSDNHHRRSLRLPGYDYAQAGAYFVTVCTQGRECLLGDVTPTGEIALNQAGHMVERWWQELEIKFPHVNTDAFVVMPNHFHGIIAIVTAPAVPGANDVGADLRVGPPCAPDAHPVRADLRVGPPGVPEIMQWFKTMTTNEYIRGVKTMGWSPFPGKLWQRNYYDHVIRDDAALVRIRRYIDENPLRWALDRENPAVYTRGGLKP